MVRGVTCPFCLIVEGQDPRARVVFRDDSVTAFFPLSPATSGHTLVVPNRHVRDIRELEVHEGRNLADAVRRVAEAIWAGVRPEGLNVVQSNGEAATQTVPHVHVHLVPRWTGDRMELRWPDGPAQDESGQNRTLAAVRASLPAETFVTSAGDRRQHLSFIQAVITRMSQASSTSKSWLLPIVTVAFGYAVTNDAPAVALLGCLAVLVFGLLDANYLKQERAFRELYDQIARGSAIPSFSMNPALASPVGGKINYWPAWQDLQSWAVALVYGPLLAAGVAVFVWLHCR